MQMQFVRSAPLNTQRCDETHPLVDKRNGAVDKTNRAVDETNGAMDETNRAVDEKLVVARR